MAVCPTAEINVQPELIGAPGVGFVFLSPGGTPGRSTVQARTDYN